MLIRELSYIYKRSLSANVKFSLRDVWVASRAVDGNSTSRFASSYDAAYYYESNEWLMIDLGERYPIARIKLVGDEVDYVGHLKVKLHS